jgi:outer membrane receptor protein involved in Fe transport
MKIIYNLLFLLLPALAWAQTGKISGRVINSKTNERLAGATVTIEKLNRKTVSDQNGVFSIGGLAAGSYSVTCTYIGYNTKVIDEVLVKNGEVFDLVISLEPKASDLMDVVVRTPASRENQSAVLISQKNAASVSDGISAEVIKRTPDRNTSDVLKRVSGVAIQDNKFAVVRGLNDRYNTAYLNGAPLPSSESDRKAFAFDIFPSNMLENLVIYKSATPDLPGEFAGGVINISTSSIPTKNFITLTAGTGMNTITTFKEGSTYKGGNLDWLGVDDGSRALPEAVPPPQSFPTRPDDRAALAKNFDNNWALEKRNVLPNMNLQYTQGINVLRKGSDFLGILLSATYNKSFTFADGELRSYEYSRQNPSSAPIFRGDFNDQTNSENTLAAAIANISLKLNNNNKISWKTIVSSNSEDKVILRNGAPNVTDEPDFKAYSSARWFTSNVIASSQLYGEHNIPSAKLKVNWLGSYGSVQREIPNLRQITYSLAPGETEWVAAIPSGTISADNAGTMFFSTTDERIYSGKLDLSKSLDFGSNFKNIIKAGGYYQLRNRDFDARLVGFGRYVIPGSVSFNTSLAKLPEDRIFDTANMGRVGVRQGGFLLLDGTQPSFTYDATSKLAAAYLMADSRIGNKLRAVYGVRFESFQQELNSYLSSYDDKLALNTTKDDFLPSANLIYSLSTKQNIRASYSRTLNRPEFRELAPFLFYDFSNRISIGGDPDLARASIHNFDLRYEWFPGRGQLLSGSIFYKDFINPIELVADANNDRQAFFQNALSGINYGLELEFRTLIGTMFKNNKSRFLDNLTVSANGALIFSEVNVGDFGTTVKGVQDRNLQGQSPYVLNANISYNDTQTGWGFSLSGNRVGQRIFIVGSVNDLDLWEQGRTVVDMQVSKTLLKNKLDLKLNVRDLLRQKQIFYFELNENSKYDEGTDLIYNTRSFGSVISLTASYKIK